MQKATDPPKRIKVIYKESIQSNECEQTVPFIFF